MMTSAQIHSARCSVLVCLALCGQTQAHSITVLRGTALISADAVSLTLEVHGEDLLHVPSLHSLGDGSYTMADVWRAAEFHGQALSQRIAIRNDKGEVIHGSRVTWTIDGSFDDRIEAHTLRPLVIRYECVYTLNHANRYLSFQQHSHDARGGLYSNIVLDVRTVDQGLTTVQLTQGGNVEVVLLDRPNPTRTLSQPTHIESTLCGCSIESFVLWEAQRTIRSVVTIHAEGVTVDTYIPTLILETWLPIKRRDRDFLDPDEQKRNLQDIEVFLEKHNPVFINGQRVFANAMNVHFLDVAELAPRSTTPRRHSALTSRLRISTEYYGPDPVSEFNMKWSLFNSSILTSQALVIADNGCFEHEFSTYRPLLNWSRTSSVTSSSTATK